MSANSGMSGAKTRNMSVSDSGPNLHSRRRKSYLAGLPR